MSVGPSQGGVTVKIETPSTMEEYLGVCDTYSGNLSTGKVVGWVLPSHISKNRFINFNASDKTESSGIKVEIDSEEKIIPMAVEVKSEPIKRKRGRPRKNPLTNEIKVPKTPIAIEVKEKPIARKSQQLSKTPVAVEVKEEPIKRKRGRPRKYPISTATFGANSQNIKLCSVKKETDSISEKVIPTINDVEKPNLRKRSRLSKSSMEPKAKKLKRNGSRTSKGKKKTTDIFAKYRHIIATKQMVNLHRVTAPVEDLPDSANFQVEPKQVTITIIEFYCGNDAVKKPEPKVLPAPKEPKIVPEAFLPVVGPEVVIKTESEVFDEPVKLPEVKTVSNDTIAADVQSTPIKSSPRKVICEFIWHKYSLFKTAD